MESPYKPDQNEEMQFIPLVKLCYHKFLQNWYWFLLSAVVCLVAGWFYQQVKPRIYERQSVMLIEESSGTGYSTSFKRNSRNNMTSLLELNGVSVGDNLKNEIFIISSKRLMMRVVEKLRLDVDYVTEENLHEVALYGNERPFEVIFQDPFTEEKAKRMKRMVLDFKVKKLTDAKVLLTGFTDLEGNNLPDQEAQLGQTVQTPYGKLIVIRGKRYARWEDQVIEVRRMPVPIAANVFQSKMAVTEYDKETSLIVLTIQEQNEKRADDVLNTLYNTYKEDVVENKNRVAQNTAKFIDERIGIISSELSSVENQLADFKKRNQLVDFRQTPQLVMNETSTARQQSLAIETQLNVAQFLNNYLNNRTNDRDLIPALNLGDNTFNQQIAAYNTLLNDRNRLADNTSEDQSVIRDMDRQLRQFRQSIGT